MYVCMYVRIYVYTYTYIYMRILRGGKSEEIKKERERGCLDYGPYYGSVHNT